MTRLPSIDALKVLLALAVVWAHAVLLGAHFDTLNYLVGQGLVRPAVPTFAMVSGFLFNSTHRRGTTTRWLTTISGAYLLWCLIYAPLWLPEEPDLAHVFGRLIVGPLHLWYMAALVAAVLLMAAVLRWAPGALAARRWLLGLAVGALLTGSALQAADFFGPVDIPLNAYRNGIFVEFPYAAFGFLLADRVAREGRGWLPPAPRLWLLFAGLAALRLIEARLSLAAFGLSPSAPPEFPPLAVAFSLVLLMATLRTDLPRVPLPLGTLSMAMYFLHYMVVMAALSLGITALGLQLLLGAGVPALVALLYCAARREAGRLLAASRRTERPGAKA